MNNKASIEALPTVIRYHRKKSGLTRIELASLAGVGKTVVFDIEHGKSTVQLDTLLKILTVLNITTELSSPLMQSFNTSMANEKS